MANIEDRWMKVGSDGRKIRTERYGRGLRWRATWAEPGTGRYPSRSFATKDAAEAHLETVGAAKRGGTYVAAERGRMTVGEYTTVWLDAQTHLKPSGRERVEGIIETHVRLRWGDMALADVEHEDVQAWVNTLDGSPATIQRVHGVFARILDGAVKTKRVAGNEARGVNLPRRAPREHRYLTVAELDRLLARCGPWAPVVRCLALTGLRVGEVAELRVRDVSLARQRAAVSRSMTTLAGRRVTGTTKTSAGVRSVPLAGEVVDDMRVLTKGRRRDDLVYLTPKGAQLRKDNLRRAFRRAVVAVALDVGLRPHDLRHTAALMAVASGASVKTVQRMMGHASAAITLDVYSGLFDQDLDDMLGRMGKYLERERGRAQRPDSAQAEAA